MADTLVDASMDPGADLRGLWGPYYINTSKGIKVSADSLEDPAIWRTTDGGATTPWPKTIIENGDAKSIAAFFDQEVPGDTGNLVHIVYLERDANDVKYVSYNIDTGTLGTIRIVDSTVTVASSIIQNRTAITKTRNGNLIIAISTQTEIKGYRSTDGGVVWTEIASPFETALEEDWLLLFPANTGDGADAVGIFWGRVATDISAKMYDDSANTWTKTLILSTMQADSAHRNMDGAVRHSDGLLSCCANSNEDSPTNDLRTFTVNPNSIASPIIDTTTANVFTNQAETAQCCLFIHQPTNNVYVGYLKGGTWLATVDAVYHISTDGMASWGTEKAYSQAPADDIRILSAGRSGGNDGSLFQPAFFNDDLVDTYVNLVNHVVFSPVVVVATKSGGRSSGPGLQSLKTFTDEEQVTLYHARQRRLSLNDVMKGMFRTLFLPLTPAVHSSALWPTRDILYTVMAEIKIDAASADGVIFEIGSTAHGAGITMNAGVLSMFAGNNSTDGVDITFTPVIGRRLWVALAMDPGNGRIGMYIDGKLQERKKSSSGAFTSGLWAVASTGAGIGQVDGTHNDRVSSVNTLSNISMVSQVSFFSGQVPRGLLI